MAKRSHCDGFLHCICLLAACLPSLSITFPVSGQQISDAAKADPLQAIHRLLDAGQFVETEKALRSYLDQHLTSADADFLLGYTLFREGRPKDSLAAFTEGARFRRPGASDLKIIAADYVVLGDFADADKWLTLVTNETPEDAEAWYLLGRTKYNENRFEEAIQCFERTLTLRPGDVKAENNLGLSYQGINYLDEAKTAFENSIAWQKDSPAKDAQPYLNMGILLSDQNQLSQALPYLQRAAAIAPRNPKVLEQLGRVYDQLKMPDEAAHELEQAIALAPDVAALHFRLGQVYRHQGRQQQAQQQFDICARLNSSHSSAETPNPAGQN